MKKRTIKKSIKFEGRGIHTGEPCKIILYPKEDDGIIFVKDNVEIPLSLDFVLDTDHGTNIGTNGKVIRTIEHLTSAFFGLSIDSVIVEVFGPEIPIMDGSSKVFCEKIIEAGLKELKEDKEFVKIKKLFSLQENGKFIGVRPSKKFSVTSIISYDHIPIFKEIFEFNELSEYKKEVAGARTFGILQWKDELKKKGLIKGIDYNNLLLFDEKKNITRKRFNNEVSRHKCLDFLGDLSLFSLNINGDFLIFRTGHSLHYKFCKLLKEKEDLWSIT